MSTQSIISRIKKETKKGVELFTKQNPELIARAKDLGRAGFEAGKQAPAQCSECMAMCEGNEVGNPANIAIMQAWNSAWGAAHAKSIAGRLAEILAS